MLKIATRHHDPEKIYDFLEKSIGNLNMYIRGDFAIIQFDDHQHYELAREKFVSFYFNDDNLSLVPYSEQQPQPIPQVPQISTSREEGRRKMVNQPLENIISRLQDYDRKNQYLSIINTSAQNMAEYMCTFDAFLASINYRLQPNSQPIKEDFQKEIKGLLKQKLSKIQKLVKSKFCNLNHNLRTFNFKNIDIDNVISFRAQTPPSFPPCGLRCYNHYLAKRKNMKKQVQESIRTIRALNQQQFACSVNSRKQGSVRLYNIKNCEDYQSISLPQGQTAASLLMMEKHILVGSSDSYFSFFNYDQPTFQEVSHQVFPKTWEITQIVEVSRVQSGCKFVALGKWSEEKRAKKLFESTEPKDVVKLFYAYDCKITESASTLIFEQLNTIVENARISTIGLGGWQNKILAVATQNNLECFDMNLENKSSCSQKFQNQIYRIGRFSEDLILLGQQNRVTIFDIRDHSLQKQRFDIKNDIRSIISLSQSLFAYGGHSQLGIYDIRQPSKPVWRQCITHKGAQITDLAVVGSYLVSGDSQGQLSSWHSLPSTI